MDTINTFSSGQYLVSPGELRTEARSLAAPLADEVQIAVRATTLCGSDIHYYQHGRNGTIEVREPLCLGHEAAGEVVAAGSGVDLQVGDRVAVECGVSCEECEWCLTKRYNLCPKMRFRSSGSAWPHFQGTLQSRINHPARWCHRIPASVSFEEGALLEPLSVAVHACRRANVQPDTTCTIIGAGAIGLLCAVAARSAGCTSIAIADIVESRVAFALDNGFADIGHVVSTKKPISVEESLDIAKATAGVLNSLQLPSGAAIGRTNYTFECTGAALCVQTAVYATKSGGKVALVGMGTPNIMLPISEASAREVDLIPTWRYAGCYPEALRILEACRESATVSGLAKLITHRFDGIESVPDALRMASSSVDGDRKMIVKVAVTNSD